jgi:hypothetical protein
MITNCERCGRRYDDAQRWTICPHPELHVAAPTRAQQVVAVKYPKTPQATFECTVGSAKELYFRMGELMGQLDRPGEWLRNPDFKGIRVSVHVFVPDELIEVAGEAKRPSAGAVGGSEPPTQ